MKSENIFKAILQKYGFPSVEKAGVFGENIAYKSIMKLNVSEQYLDSVENLFNKKLFDPLAYAMIKDKYLYMKDKNRNLEHSFITVKMIVMELSLILFQILKFKPKTKRNWYFRNSRRLCK